MTVQRHNQHAAYFTPMDVTTRDLLDEAETKLAEAEARLHNSVALLAKGTGSPQMLTREAIELGGVSAVRKALESVTGG